MKFSLQVQMQITFVVGCAYYGHLHGFSLITFQTDEARVHIYLFIYLFIFISFSGGKGSHFEKASNVMSIFLLYN